MAKALFHKNQRVYVKPVGTWAIVERVIPHWVKDVEEPLRITYDVALGREFTAGELLSEAVMHGRNTLADDAAAQEKWRVFRMKNRWQGGDCDGHHPYPGTFPVVTTDDHDWGGWRVPGAEYDRDPQRIEHQARMIVNAPEMLRVIRTLCECASEQPENVPDELMAAAKRGVSILRHVYEATDAPPNAETPVAAE